MRTRKLVVVLLSPLLFSCSGKVIIPPGSTGTGGHGGSSGTGTGGGGGASSTGTGGGGGASSTGTGGGGGAGATGAGGGGGATTCNGTGLLNDPSNTCPIPPPPDNSCSGFALTAATHPLPSNPLLVIPSGDTRLDGETSVVIDPNDSTKAYAATINAIVGPDSSPTGKCILGKSLTIYTWNNSMSRWDIIPGNENLPQNTSQSGAITWLTDPDLAVGPDGTVYLSALLSQAEPNCATAESNNNTIALYYAPPGQKLQPFITPDSTGVPDLGTGGEFDHPKVTVSPTSGVVVVSFVKSDGPNDVVEAVQRSSTGTLIATPIPTVIQADTFPNPVFVGNRLYIASSESSTHGSGPIVSVFDWNGTGWNTTALGQQITSHLNYLLTSAGQTFPGTPLGQIGGNSLIFEIDPTPSMAVGTLGSSATPVAYVTYEVAPSSGTVGVEIQAGSPDQQLPFQLLVSVPLPSGVSSLFHPNIALDGADNILDLVAYGVKPASGGNVANQTIGIYFFRFDASTGAAVGSPIQLNAGNEWSVGDLPNRTPAETNGNFSLLWPPGEYISFDTTTATSMVAFPEGVALSGNARSTNALTGTVTGFCPTAAFEVALNGDLWECSNCNCGGVTTAVSGCVSPADIDREITGGATAACGDLCPTAGCGGALDCPVTSACVAPTFGQAQGKALADQSCQLNQATFAAPPTDQADYVASDNGTSAGQLVLGDVVTTVPAPGTLSLNASTNPPQSGSGVEVSRIRLSPSSFHAGGILSSTISNMLIQNTSRFRGTFSDSTHFSIPAGGAEFVVGVTSQPDGLSTSSNLNLIAWNPQPLTGTLDLSSNKMTLQGSVTDSTGDSLSVQFSGQITQHISQCPNPTNVPAGLFGFESLDWSTTGSPVLSLVDSPITEGCHALSVQGQGYIPITGPAFSTTAVGQTTSAIGLDVFVPASQPNPSYLGAVQLYLTCPSANFWNQYMGQDELTGLPQGAYSTLRYPVPSPILSVLTENHPDCFFNINLNINATPTPLFLDNLRFVQ